MRGMRHALAFALLAIAACGEIATSSDAGIDSIDAAVDPCIQAAVSIDDFFVCLSRGVCDAYEDCGGSDTAALDCDNLPLQIFGDLSPTPLKTVIHDAVDSGRAQWDPAAAAACLATLKTARCSVFKASDIFESCHAIVGFVNNGQPCQNDIECATPGAQCVAPVGGSTDPCLGFTCKAPVPAGQLCTADSFCRPEDRCVMRRGPNGNDISTCSTGEAGQACDRDNDCDRNLFCNGGLNDGTVAGICTNAKAAGATCRVDEECTGELVCVGNFGASNGTCRDVRPAGASCDRDALDSCHGFQFCDAAADALGTCHAAPLAGAACGTVNGMPAFCGFFMACETGMCRPVGDVGEPCTNSGGFGGDADGCNLGLFCDNEATMAPTGACQAPQANGAACKPDNSGNRIGTSRMCASDWCANDLCVEFPTCNF